MLEFAFGSQPTCLRITIPFREGLTTAPGQERRDDATTSTDAGGYATAGLSVRTQGCYAAAVRQLAEHYHRSPDELTEEDLRQYFLYLANEKRVARATATIALCGIRFFLEQTLRREWTTLRFVRPAREHTLPVVLSRDEVRRVLHAIREPVYRACLTTIYAGGLRLLEGAHLQVVDVDSARMVWHIYGKGKRDRYVPLPAPVLPLLRAHWRTHRSPVWLFLAPPRRGQRAGMPVTPGPVTRSSLQCAFQRARRAAGLTKRASVHTLRIRTRPTCWKPG